MTAPIQQTAERDPVLEWLVEEFARYETSVDELPVTRPVTPG